MEQNNAVRWLIIISPFVLGIILGGLFGIIFTVIDLSFLWGFLFMVSISWFLGIIYVFLSLQESAIDKHYYVTFFGRGVGLIKAGSGLYILPAGFYKIDEVKTEIIEKYFPAPEEKISFTDDHTPVNTENGMVRTYRVTTSDKNIVLIDPVDVEPEYVTAIKDLHTTINKWIETEKSKTTPDPLDKRLTLEPRFLVKFKPLRDDSNGEELTLDSVQKFFEKFTSIDDLTNAIGVTTLDILANIFGRLTPNALIANQEVISKIITLRLKSIFTPKGVHITHFGLTNPGLPKTISASIRDVSSAIAEKATTITKAEAQRDKDILVGQGVANALQAKNTVDLARLEEEAKITATAKELLYKAEADGVEKLAKSLGLEGKEAILIKQLETLKDGMKDNNLNVILGGNSDIENLLKIATTSLTRK